MREPRSALLVLLCSCGGITSGSGVADGGSHDGAARDATRDGAASRDASSADAAHPRVDAQGGCDSGIQAVQCVASGPGYGSAALAVDEQNVYWAVLVQGDGGAVVSVPRAGGPVVTLATGPAASSMASDRESLYWVAGVGNQVAVYRVPTGGGTVTTLVTATVQPSPFCIAVDAANVYWTAGSSVLQVAKTGGSVHTLATSSDGAYAIAVGPTSVYWGAGGIVSSPLDGGTSTTLALPASGIPGFCDSLSLANGDLFAALTPLAHSAVQTIVRVPTSGATGPSVLISSGGPDRVAADERGFFWVSDLGLSYATFDGGTTTLVPPPVAYEIRAIALASDGTLYWTTLHQVQSTKP